MPLQVKCDNCGKIQDTVLSEMATVTLPINPSTGKTWWTRKFQAKDTSIVQVFACSLECRDALGGPVEPIKTN